MFRVVHFEIGVDNPEKTIEFYQNVFGWKVDKWEDPSEYWMINTGDPKQPGINGGFFRRPGPANIIHTINVPDIDEFMKKITEAGGELIGEKMMIPNVGFFIYCKDPDGNAFGIIQED